MLMPLNTLEYKHIYRFKEGQDMLHQLVYKCIDSVNMDHPGTKNYMSQFPFSLHLAFYKLFKIKTASNMSNIHSSYTLSSYAIVIKEN